MSSVIVRSNGHIQTQRAHYVSKPLLTRRTSAAKMISKNGIISVYGFLLGLSVLFALHLVRSDSWPVSNYLNGHDVNPMHLFVLYAVIANVLVRIINRGIGYKVKVHHP